MASTHPIQGCHSHALLLLLLRRVQQNHNKRLKQRTRASVSTRSQCGKSNEKESKKNISNRGHGCKGERMCEGCLVKLHSTLA